MAKFRPEIEISGRLLIYGQKMHIFLAKKIFGQNDGNFGPPAISEAKNSEKNFQNAIFLNFADGQLSAGNRNFQPIIDLRPENTYFLGRKKFWTKRREFRPLGHFRSQKC